MTERPEKLFVVQGWVRKAESDFTNAEHTLTMKADACPFDTVCFHAQQTVEKYLKALLVQKGIDFPKTHEISELVDLFPTGLKPPVEVKEQDALTDYAVDSRYPDDLTRISATEAGEAMAIARRIRIWARNLLPKAAL